MIDGVLYPSLASAHASVDSCGPQIIASQNSSARKKANSFCVQTSYNDAK